MTRRRSRGLLPEEEQLWRRVADTAQPLHAARRSTVPTGASPAAPAKGQADPPAFETFRLGERAQTAGLTFDLSPPLADRLTDAPLRMDRKSFERMTRGKLVPEGRIDLHGMTLAQAHPTLTRFVIASHAEGRRLILVITGKGRRTSDSGPIPQQTGVLKHQVPQWLAMPPLGGLVLQVTEAHLKHGGAGAYYVYLRRQR